VKRCSPKGIKLVEDYGEARANQREMPGYDKDVAETGRKLRAYIAELERAQDRLEILECRKAHGMS
jgi:hypothetical protein